MLATNFDLHDWILKGELRSSNSRPPNKCQTKAK
jgi:hypothetical protein